MIDPENMDPLGKVAAMVLREADADEVVVISIKRHGPKNACLDVANASTNMAMTGSCEAQRQHVINLLEFTLKDMKSDNKREQEQAVVEPEDKIEPRKPDTTDDGSTSISA